MERDELHELVTFLKEEVEAGRVEVASDSTIESLGKVCFASDGKVDPSTVDSSVRAMALALWAAKAQREMKNISLRDVQSDYFEILDLNFGKIYSEMKKHHLNPQQIAESVASNKNLVDAFATDVENFASGIREFWETNGPVVETHLRDLGCLKSVFGGDVFPSYAANIACSVGLYMDTIVLPDPILKLLMLGSVMNPKDLFFYVTKHALNVLSYRDLALADVEPPIVVIAPDHLTLENSYRGAMQIAGEADSLAHGSRMFGRAFSTVDEFQTFLKQIPDADQLISRLVDPSRLLFDVEWSGPLTEQIDRYTKEITAKIPRMSGAVAEAVYNAVFGRMIQTNDAIFRSYRYGGTPLIDAPTSWRYLMWKYEYDGKDKSSPVEAMRDILLSKAIEVEGGSYGMLSGIPPSVLIDLRRNGASAELRAVIRNGIKEIDLASETALSDVSKAVIANIDKAFSEHDRQLRALASSRNKFFGLDVGRWTIIGGLSIASPLVHSPTLGVLAALAKMAGTPSPSELWRRFRELRSNAENLQRSPTGIMFRHLKNKFGFFD